ncbi:hypothetical protein LSCM4_01044 [Leishmania orientalis]|uniref:Ubiquitin-like domain-containing protein n=1 Tax=Leishmania orientalis TaxID=2249476 RepID=A0A836GHW4_9TRYP|nr:hypothetical protein LSCM4_01044 [Leishmania orientalis]
MELKADAEQPTTCVYVLSDVDGYKYKLVMQGDVQLLSVRKVKRYLQRASGIHPAQQLITFNSVRLDDTMSGKDAGLFDGAILRLQQVSPSSAALATYISVGGTGGGNSFTVSRGDARNKSKRTSSGKDGSSVDEALSPIPLSAEQAAVGGPQLICSPRTLPPPLRCLSPNQSNSGPARDAGDAASRTRREAEAGICFHSLPVLAEATSVTASAPRTTPQGPSASVNGDGEEIHAHCRELEGKVATLSLDNVRLREQLQSVARQAAEVSTDWRQEEEVRRLKAALVKAQQGAKDAERAAAHRWRIQEEELVKELDLLREERRRFYEESTAQEVKLQELVRSMEGEIRGLKYELHDKDEALQAVRLSLAELRFKGSPRTGVTGRGSDSWSAGQASHPFSPAVSLSAGMPLHQRHSDGNSGLDELAEAALGCLTRSLEHAAPLELDPANDTCVVPVADDLNVLVTLDRETERLYLYATLLNCLPSSSQQRMQLYEMLLEGALLGKDTGGAGVGVSLESNLVLMSVSTSLRHSDASALALLAPSFVAAARSWTKAIDALLSTRRGL